MLAPGEPTPDVVQPTLTTPTLSKEQLASTSNLLDAKPSTATSRKSTTALASNVNLDANVPRNSTPRLNGTEALEMAAAEYIGAPMDALPASLPSYTIEPADHRGRKIVAEDFTMNLAPVKRLTELCLETLIKNFSKRPILKELTTKHRALLLKSVNVDVPLILSSKLIDDAGDADEGSIDGALYWKRACLKYFPRSKCDPLLHGDSWKTTFFELLLEEIIEQYVPEISSQTELVDYLRISSSFVKKLNIKQLRPVNWISSEKVIPGLATKKITDSILIQPPGSQKDKSNSTTRTQSTIMSKDSASKTSSRPGTSGSRFEDEKVKPSPVKPNEMRSEPLSHLDMNIVLGELTNLKELNLFYGMRDCGMGFSWNQFGITLDDTFNLSQALSRSRNLQSLSLKACHLTDDLCQMLCCGLQECTGLEKLDLSHNRIQDLGARALATLISIAVEGNTRPSGQKSDNYLHLKHLDLSNNRIGVHGAVALGKALAYNTHLTSLNLRLNTEIGDEGGVCLIQSFCQDNFTLHDLNLAGCQLGPNTVNVIADTIKRYGVVNTRLAYEKDHPGSLGQTGTEQGAADDGNNDKNELQDLEEEDDNQSVAMSATSASKRRTVRSGGSKSNKAKGGKVAATSKAAVPKKAPAKEKAMNRRRISIAAPSNKSSSAAKGRSGQKDGNLSKINSDSAGTVSKENAGAESDLEATVDSNAGTNGNDRQNDINKLLGQLPFPCGLMHLDISSNLLIPDEPCGKQLFDAVKVNHWLVQLDARGTSIGEHYVKAIAAVVSNNKEQSEPQK